MRVRVSDPIARAQINRRLILLIWQQRSDVLPYDPLLIKIRETAAAMRAPPAQQFLAKLRHSFTKGQEVLPLLTQLLFLSLGGR